jgi:dihydrofolate reductase
VKLALIAAVARNRVIGAGGRLPWHIAADLKRFKRLTMGHAVLMGRKTYQSIGRPLAGRRNVVVSRSVLPEVESYPSPEAALAALAGEERVFVIGGGSLYERLLGQADELYLTLVDQEPAGDTLFPPYEQELAARFRLTAREDHEGYHFLDYAARRGPGQDGPGAGD